MGNARPPTVTATAIATTTPEGATLDRFEACSWLECLMPPAYHVHRHHVSIGVDAFMLPRFLGILLVKRAREFALSRDQI